MNFPHTIDDAKELQSRHGIGYRHVAHIDDEGFVLAHTDDERASGTDLADCHIHQWLTFDENSPYGSLACCFEEPGWYIIHDLHEVEELTP